MCVPGSAYAHGGGGLSGKNPGGAGGGDPGAGRQRAAAGVRIRRGAPDAGAADAARGPTLPDGMDLSPYSLRWLVDTAGHRGAAQLLRMPCGGEGMGSGSGRPVRGLYPVYRKKRPAEGRNVLAGGYLGGGRQEPAAFVIGVRPADQADWGG